ncbi:MAG TPA: histidine kinase dimerization/phospho-acceptor domain-containing protein [Usitatibacter sp.]|nr:histidine kinase dimerization/phospho-acceptor domain-containing protein [Usitatibacter sp.]
MTTILKVSKTASGRDAMLRALRDAGLGVVEVDDWDQARERLAAAGSAVVVCDAASVGPDATGLARAVAAAESPARTAVPKDALRSLSHDLRTPLSAMAGWLHLLETGRLDEAGMKRAFEKLRGNIEDQVRTLDRYVGSRTQEGQR